MKTTCIILYLNAAFCLCLSLKLTATVPDDTFIELPEMAEKNGYPTTEHIVRTDDGYILRMHRMRRNITQNIPILLVHGILGCSEDFLRMGLNKSLAYMLADEGYDVWLGNLRGNLYTSHESLDKNDMEFWNFSFDEHGKYDVPKMIEEILKITGSTELHYVAWSMGTTSYFVACNMRPDIMSSVVTFVALSPIASLGPKAKIAAKTFYENEIPKLAKKLKIAQLLYNDPIYRLLISFFCNAIRSKDDMCYRLSFPMMGEDYSQIDWEKSTTIFMKLQPFTVKQIEHYAQMALNNSFSQYDWGKEENVKKYGRPYPIRYNVTANRASTALFYAMNDGLCTYKGVTKVYKKMNKKYPNMTIGRRVPYKMFNHNDFLFAKDVRTLVNEDIVRIIPILYEKYKSQNYTIKVNNEFESFDDVDNES